MTGGSPRRGLVAVAVAAGVLLLFGLQLARFVDYVNDDAYITFRYSRNLAAGVGPYFNPGEHVEGYTNLSLMLAMAAVAVVSGPQSIPVAAKTLGGLAAVATLLLCMGIARRGADRVGFSEREALVWGGLAAGLVAVAPGFAVNSMSGLETALLAFCLAAAVWCDSGPRPRRAGVALWLSMAVLTRPEGILIAGTYLGCRLLVELYHDRARARDRTRAHDRDRDRDRDRGERHDTMTVVRIGLVVGSVFAGRLLLRYLLYDGELLPNTYYAKAGGFWGAGAWEYVREGALRPLFGLAGAAIALLGWSAPGRPRATMVPLAATALVGAALPFVTGTD